jgi:hypothetical protein
MSATPILDLENDPPKPRAGWGATLIGLGIGGGIGLAAGTSRSLPGLSVLTFIPAIYLAVAFHELGHLMAGSLVGMPPGGIVIGGFLFLKSGDRWIFRFNFRNIFGGGIAKPLPAKGEFRRAQYAWMVAGGPIASIVASLAAWLVFQRLGSGAEDWIGSLFWANVFTVLSLVPYSVGLTKTDGARLWFLLRNPESARAWMALLMIQTQEANGVRPRDWDPELVEQMLASSDADNDQPWRQLLASIHYTDLGDDAKAMEHLEKSLASSARAGKVIRQYLFLEAAGACARVRGNAAHADVWLKRALKLRKPESADCTLAEIALCEGRAEDAVRHVAAVRSFLARRKVDSGLARYAKERHDEMERTASAGAGSPRIVR